MCTNKLYFNAPKCIFGCGPDLSFGMLHWEARPSGRSCKVGGHSRWPIPKNQKNLRKWLGLANYLHKYRENYANMARPLSNLVKKDVEFCWTSTKVEAFKAVKESLLYAPILALPDSDRPFNVVCDASDFAICCVLLQNDVEGRERVIALNTVSLKLRNRTIQFTTRSYLL